MRLFLLFIESTGINEKNYVGTKRGKLKEVQVKWSDSDSFCTGAVTDEITVEDLQDTNGNILKPYPIFSMMHVGTNSHVPVSASDDGSTRIGACILTGGGDRYITVWETIWRIWTFHQSHCNQATTK